ncbi:MAG: sigma-54-dependent Fis family transcriptional regulator [Woeseiaceae bacterium]|nr:sigma-54-dependent Fis family transcriptional regulator [Woeseiaceae bacterium]
MTTGNDSRAKVLVLDANLQHAAELSHRLKYLDYDPVIAGSGVSLNEQDHVAAVIIDSDGDDDIVKTASEIRRQHPGLPFLCLSADAALQRGPNWALDLPLKRSQLERLLGRAERYQGSERRHRITGNSHPVRAVRRLIEQVADFDTTVLVTGQSGTGKELVARTIHELSARSDKPFVPINCGAIPADLLESELFGHEKGAFTGAISARTGRFELAEGGTLFLDEIGDMSFDMQVKLLRVLQERTFERVGSGKSKRCNVRIIAATHKDLPGAVKAREFREDLYYRLNVFPIEMPPLFQRVSDLPQLLEELLISHSGSQPGALRISKPAIEVLACYPWPGNIRELSNLVERLAIIKPEGVIDVDDLPPKYREAATATAAETNQVAEAMQLTNANLKECLQTLERDLIAQAMQACDGVVAKAARLLKTRRTTLVEKLGKYDLS